MKDQDLRKNFEHSHGDHICRCSTELPCRESHTGQQNISLLPELDCSGFVVFWACTVLEVCRCLRGLATA